MNAYGIRQGNIYLFENCPSLDGDDVKDRPVVVIDVPHLTDVEHEILVVPVTTRAPQRQSDPDAVGLPNWSENPQTTTGLRKRCWAIPRWAVPARVDHLAQCRRLGYLSGAKLRLLVAATLERLGEEDG